MIYVALYANREGLVYKTMLLVGYPYPLEQILHVYGKEGTTTIEIRDD